MGRVSGACVPRAARGRRGKGVRECAASGFVLPSEDVVDDVRQGLVGGKYADVTPGFGTWHPQDVVGALDLADPTPIPRSRPTDRLSLSKQDLQISDEEIAASVREGRPARPGH